MIRAALLVAVGACACSGADSDIGRPCVVMPCEPDGSCAVESFVCDFATGECLDTEPPPAGLRWYTNVRECEGQICMALPGEGGRCVASCESDADCVGGDRDTCDSGYVCVVPVAIKSAPDVGCDWFCLCRAGAEQNGLYSADEGAIVSPYCAP